MKTSIFHALAALSMLAACANESRDNATRGDTIRPSTPLSGGDVIDASRIQFAPFLNVQTSTMQRTPGGAFYRDLEVGSGAAVDSGMTVSIHYAGHLPNGTPFDANQAPSAPFSFIAGVGQVIQGFDEAVDGMRVGGKRQIVIPPELGYGSQAVGPIPPNSVLVFVIEVVAAR